MNLEIEKLKNFRNEITGYPTIDKPWEQNYIKGELEKVRPKRTVYQEVYQNNENYLSDLSLEYFGAKINYNMLFNKIDATAKAFEEYGIKKGDFVTICVAGIPETVYSFYALSKIGAVANMIAPHFDKKDLIERIADCESKVLIVMDKFYDEIKVAVKNSNIKNIIVLPTMNSSLLKLFTERYKLEKYSNELYWNQFLKDGSKRVDSSTVNYEPNMPLTMVYSSGTTGASKGILLSNDSFQNSIQAYPASGVDISRGQKFYQIIPPWYSTGLSTSIHLPLSYGTSVFMDPRFERDVFVKNILKAKPNYTVAGTSMYEGFLDEKLLRNRDLSFFNYPFEGGEPLREEVANNIEKVFKEHGSDAKLRVAYGQCECGAAITTQTQKSNHSAGSVGIPLPGVIVGIFDEKFNELKYNQRGYIYANTECSMLGYYNNPEETNKYFHYDSNGTRWNGTGDIGYMNQDGNLFVEGRATDYTIINDKKIYNFDIENIIMSLKEVKIVDVLEKMDENGNPSLVAHIIFEEEYLNSNPNLQVEFEKIQQLVYNKTNDSDCIPYMFKVRTEFPYAKSGKRDTEKMKNETDDFVILDNKELQSVKVKRLS